MRPKQKKIGVGREATDSLSAVPTDVFVYKRAQALRPYKMTLFMFSGTQQAVSLHQNRLKR